MYTIITVVALVMLASAKRASSDQLLPQLLGTPGIQIIDIQVENMSTIFEFDNSGSPGSIFENLQTTVFKFRQAEAIRKPLTVTVDVNTDTKTDAVFRIFLGPKYDSSGSPLSIEDNWLNFVEIDWTIHRLSVGKTTVVRTINLDSSLIVRLLGTLQNQGLNVVVSAQKWLL
ncbi:arylphorin subunit alpha-like [Leguminivora glycinivorella]|uniref:arylphorin subunit alpha-like n=1 Tax=Leguminivora glycinivorella TaxID=1035111 RepID=UPI002010B8C4|nr:arylphorin subunit alpha-like [Leguminivora glycinivorella]